MKLITYRGSLSQISLKLGRNFVVFAPGIPTGISDSYFEIIKNYNGFGASDATKDIGAANVYINLPTSFDRIVACLFGALPLLKSAYPTCIFHAFASPAYSPLLAAFGVRWVPHLKKDDYYRVHDLSERANYMKWTRLSTYAIPWPQLFAESTLLAESVMNFSPTNPQLIASLKLPTVAPVLIGAASARGSFDERVFDVLAKDKLNVVAERDASAGNTTNWLVPLLRASRVDIVGDSPITLGALLLGKPVRHLMPSAYRSRRQRQFLWIGHVPEPTETFFDTVVGVARDVQPAFDGASGVDVPPPDDDILEGMEEIEPVAPRKKRMFGP